MRTNRANEILIGILFLTAMAGALVGGGLIEANLNTSDYLMNIPGNTTGLFVGIGLDLTNGIAVIGIAAWLLPVLEKYNRGLAYGYFGLRMVESLACIAGAFIPLLVLALSQEMLKTETPNTMFFKTIGDLLLNARTQLGGLIIPVFFSLSAMLLYYSLYQFKLLPRFISIWGFISAVMVLLLNLVKVEMMVGMLLMLPMILNEIFLGSWLIFKGFREVKQ